MIINESCGVYLFMKFFISFGFIQFKTVGFHFNHFLYKRFYFLKYCLMILKISLIANTNINY